MTHLLIQKVEKAQLDAVKHPPLRTGYQVKVHQKIKEGEKERTQIFEGLIINHNSGNGAGKTITVRKEVEGIGVEKIFPIASPNVLKIEIVRTFKVRRAKLKYMRTRSGKSARLKEKLGMTAKDAKFHGTEEVKTGKAAKVKTAKAPAKSEVVTESAPAVEAAPESNNTPEQLTI